MKRVFGFVSVYEYNDKIPSVACYVAEGFFLLQDLGVKARYNIPWSRIAQI